MNQREGSGCIRKRRKVLVYFCQLYLAAIQSKKVKKKFNLLLRYLYCILFIHTTASMCHCTNLDFKLLDVSTNKWFSNTRGLTTRRPRSIGSTSCSPSGAYTWNILHEYFPRWTNMSSGIYLSNLFIFFNYKLRHVGNILWGIPINASE